MRVTTPRHKSQGARLSFHVQCSHSTAFSRPRGKLKKQWHLISTVPFVVFLMAILIQRVTIITLRILAGTCP